MYLPIDERNLFTSRAGTYWAKYMYMYLPIDERNPIFTRRQREVSSGLPHKSRSCTRCTRPLPDVIKAIRKANVLQVLYYNQRSVFLGYMLSEFVIPIYCFNLFLNIGICICFYIKISDLCIKFLFILRLSIIDKKQLSPNRWVL